MQTTTPRLSGAEEADCQSAAGFQPALLELEEDLYRSMAAGRYDEAREYAERCVECCTPETYPRVLSILTRAQHIASARRAFAAARVVDLNRANFYAATMTQRIHHLITG